MNTAPLDKFHGSHPRNGNNVHHRERRDRDPQRLASAKTNAVIAHRYSADGAVFIQPTPDGPATSTDSANSVTL